MALLDRIDPPPVRHVYRWDLDKTYLRTEFDTLRDLLRTAFEKAKEKVNVPGTAALMRELRAHGVLQPSRTCIISGSPRQMRSVLIEKLRLDGNAWDEMVLKPNLSNMLRGRFRALRDQVGYKLPALLESRAQTPAEASETLFGDDAESDAFIYSLYADLLSGAVEEDTLFALLEACGTYEDQAMRALEALRAIERTDAVGRIFIHLDRRTPPIHFRRYGPRLVPVFNSFQAALVLMADGHLGPVSVARVAVEMVAHYGYSLLALGNSLQDLARRGLPVASMIDAVAQVLAGDRELASVLRPAPDILSAFAQRVAALGALPPPPPPVAIDYLGMLEEALPKRRGKGERGGEPA
ncbi:MAG: hypothetical protein HY901_08885 [Deltaproteobacteria bacterium]|nr:hypothetical protein [Deltaproteobacteria bacterium]